MLKTDEEQEAVRFVSCERCHGMGLIQQPVEGYDPRFVNEMVDCPDCLGTGIKPKSLT